MERNALAWQLIQEAILRERQLQMTQDSFMSS